MQIDAIPLALRPRSMWEGCDVGIRLLQSCLYSVYLCYLSVAVPLFLVVFATYAIAGWLPVLLIWIAKPWFDRTILFALSRALFAESTTPADIWDARHRLWASAPVSLALARLSASRSFRQPIVQLEGLAGRPLRERLRQLTHRHRRVARMATFTFAVAELSLWASLMILPLWLAPHTEGFEGSALDYFSPWQGFLATIGYAAVVAFVEPFYVAAGFGLYLNRRVELEAWDIEQEFRRAFAN
jgi:hypothetical protein